MIQLYFLTISINCYLRYMNTYKFTYIFILSPEETELTLFYSHPRFAMKTIVAQRSKQMRMQIIIK